jgi:hypothetical protein
MYFQVSLIDRQQNLFFVTLEKESELDAELTARRIARANNMEIQRLYQIHDCDEKTIGILQAIDMRKLTEQVNSQFKS